MNPSQTVHQEAAHSRLTAFLSILLAVCVALSVISLAQQQTLLNEDFQMQIIQDRGIDQRVAEVLPGILVQELAQYTSPTMASVFANPSDGFGADLLPPGWVNTTLEMGAHSFIAFLESNEADFSLQLELSLVKQQIAENALTLSNDVINLLPACTAEQLLAYAQDALAGQGGNLPLCKPEEPFNQLLPGIVSRWILGMSTDLPETLVIPVWSNENGNPVPAILVGAIRIIFTFQRDAFTIVALLLLLILLFNRKTLLYGIHQVGLSFIIAAICLTAATVVLFVTPVNLNLGSVDSSMALKELEGILVDGVQANLAALRGMLIRSAAVLGAGGIIIQLVTRQERNAGEG